MGQLLLACLLAGPLLVETVHSESDWLDTDKDSLRDSLALDSHKARHKEDSLALARHKEDSHKARNKEDSLDLDSHKARHKEDSPTLASPSQARGVARQGGGLLGDVYNFLADPEMLQRRQVGAVTGIGLSVISWYMLHLVWQAFRPSAARQEADQKQPNEYDINYDYDFDNQAGIDDTTRIYVSSFSNLLEVLDKNLTLEAVTNTIIGNVVLSAAYQAVLFLLTLLPDPAPPRRSVWEREVELTPLELLVSGMLKTVVG